MAINRHCKNCGRTGVYERLPSLNEGSYDYLHRADDAGRQVGLIGRIICDRCNDVWEVLFVHDLFAFDDHDAGKYVLVWRFADAPEYLRELSPHCGDEDWLALVPPGLHGRHFGWMEEGTSFGCCSVSEEVLPNGWAVRIGAHA